MVNSKYDINYDPLTIPSELRLFCSMFFLYFKNPFHIENILLNYKRVNFNHLSKNKFQFNES